MPRPKPRVVVLLGMFGRLVCGWSRVLSPACVDAEALIPSVAGAILAWVGFSRHQYASLVIRMVVFLIVAVASCIFLKNLADVLWYGHNALLR